MNMLVGTYFFPQFTTLHRQQCLIVFCVPFIGLSVSATFAVRAPSRCVCQLQCVFCICRVAMWLEGPPALHRQAFLLLILCGILYKYACARASDCQAVVKAVACARKAKVGALAMVRALLVADRVFATVGVEVATRHIIAEKTWAFTTKRMERLRRVLLRLPSQSRRKMIGSFGMNSGDLWIREFTAGGVRAVRSAVSAAPAKKAVAKKTTRKTNKSTRKTNKSTKKTQSAVFTTKIGAKIAMQRCKKLEELAASLVRLGVFTEDSVLWHEVYKEALKAPMYGAYGAVRLARNVSLVRQSLSLPILEEGDQAWQAILRMHKNVQSATALIGLADPVASVAKDAAEVISKAVAKFNKGGATFRPVRITLGCMGVAACEYECILRKAQYFGVTSAASSKEKHRHNAATWLLQCLPRTEGGVRQLRKQVIAAIFRSPDVRSGWDRCAGVSTLAWLHRKGQLKPASDVSGKELPSWIAGLLGSNPEQNEDPIPYVSSESDGSGESSEAESINIDSSEWSDAENHEFGVQTVDSESNVESDVHMVVVESSASDA